MLLFTQSLDFAPAFVKLWMPILTTDLYTRALCTTVHKNLYEASFYTNELMWD